jgi:hypothetical protein
MKRTRKLRHLYESDFREIISRTDSFWETVKNRLLPTFNTVETESERAGKEKLEGLSRNFHPDYMDEADIHDKAFHAGLEHFSVTSEMKQEFIKSTAIWLFHIFEKDCAYVFETEDGNQKRKSLQQLSIDIGAGSDWQKCNRELRLLANAIKHGPGDSLNKLKKTRPDLFTDMLGWLSNDNIKLPLADIEAYVGSIKNFWTVVFNKSP